ncbi:carbon-nitrogen hydrolase family protein [Desulfopila aestuarii]|uniref:Nitrilase n=1 Tax=Desulfopila aestuarii DSM 18488 TaxID=1121416 RepID=A0A1M7YB09_9BACT|nr:carbon-nitrogen hydrolase family protein [Desulfopila aestuarii]SHO49803.1 nitrilase [Desulfopila aestuarii DSM 18488]
MKIGLVQTNIQNDTSKNLAFVEKSIDKLADQGADLITLPETFAFLGSDQEMKDHAESIDGPTLTRLQKKARDKAVFIHCGSIFEKRGDKIFNTSVVFNRQGEQVASYSKIHLFDIEIASGIIYRESDVVTAGNDVVTFNCEGVIVGLSICYDIRFPELYRKLVEMGASLILAPAVFTLMTGKDHWEPLLKARAIENLCYIAAAGNWGICPPKYNSWGHSMVINPWGTVLVQAADCATTIITELDFAFMDSIREKLPALQHRRRDIFSS